LALVVTYLFDHFGQSFDPELYEVGKKNAVLWKPISLTGYLSTLFFINEFQFFEFNGVVPGTNGPFWSLSFEAAYYLIAGLLLFLPKIRAIPLVIIILLFGGNTIMALLPTWGFGFLLYKISAKGESSSQKKSKIIKTLALILFCLSALALISFRYIVEIDILPVLNFGLDFKWGVLPWNKNNILIDYMIAMIFGLHLIAARQLPSIMSSALLMAEKPIRWLGAITFPLYCIHAPALGFFKSISPWETESLANTIFIGASTLVLVAVFTPACDWLKHFIRKRLALVI
jgi:peptidoglycan/LPS O-acetylase OafA/YrhL